MNDYWLLIIDNFVWNDKFLQVKIAAVKATSSFLLAHEDEKVIIRQLSDCILPLVQTVGFCIDQDNEELVLKCLIDLTEKCAQLLRPQFEQIIEICLKALSNESKLDSVKHLVLEVIISLAENAPSTFRKRGMKYFQPIGKLIKLSYILLIRFF